MFHGMREEIAIAEHEILKLDHIAVAVRDLEEAIAYLRDTLGMETIHIEEVPGQKARIGFIPLGNTNLELVQPTEPASGLAKFIEQRGEGLHHICLEVRDILGSLKHCEEKGLALIDREPRVGAHNKRVAFLHPRSTKGILVELCQQ